MTTSKVPHVIKSSFKKSVEIYSLVWIIGFTYILTQSNPMAESYWMNPLTTIGILSTVAFLIYSWLTNPQTEDFKSATWEELGFLAIVAWVAIESAIMLVNNIAVYL